MKQIKILLIFSLLVTIVACKKNKIGGKATVKGVGTDVELDNSLTRLFKSLLEVMPTFKMPGIDLFLKM